MRREQRNNFVNYNGWNNHIIQIYNNKMCGICARFY